SSATEKSEKRGLYQTLLSRQLELVIRERGSLITLNIGDDESISFIDLAVNASGRAEHCFFLMHQKTQMEAQFLHRMSRRLSGERAPLRLFARPKVAGAGLRSFPQGFDRHPELTRVAESALQTDGVVHRQVPFDGVPLILSTLPGREVSDYVLILGTPLQRILDHSRRLTQRFLAISFLMIVFALYLGWLFSSTLLHPIHLISAGIDDLTHMRYQSSVSIRTGDELETIGQGLNTVLAEFHEVAMARTVQEHLLPAIGVQAGRVYCQGWSRSSAEIGGEIYDYFECAPGRWVILLADSTAYGISAAILMAMTKMAVRLLAEEPQVDSARLVTRLHDFYRLHVPDLQCLYLFLGLFEPASGNLQYTATSGLQVFFQPAGTAGNLQPCGVTAMGAGSAGDLRTHEFRLTPGSRLLVASDGLPDAFSTWCERGRDQPATEIGPWLFQRADRHFASIA
ncbi:MAG TPA: SpoIIE family protein phosphatase, partial [Candidatus Ozemobacteraceae bacterium]|nr:SpoIIE family protein phosphatase [Candidatus Ozemobacteraceae bacterium]